ncbi:2'-5' RNA ligase family protein [Tessaracoccus antarcticus]|uniref:2'-5' RNA ligase family protein n=1 Tax=Tessaracoccus antarcticus TaxID=2479848 RepID=A0A3M0GCT2_9ACTN|nr:2'-5' RNA ligase family protein [Tessaracoccus antarcticus]RMB62327.1 hypothetical protein EAX62_07180 [Tessaracoccus antarcticus]
MESFFARMEPWRKPEGALHLYVLPGDDTIDRFAAAQRSIDGVEHLPLMPEAYLHCTLQRLAEFDDEVAQQDFTRLGDCLGAALSGLPSFDLTFGGPRAGEVAVEVSAASSPEWDGLVTSSRRAIVEAWGHEPPAPPAAPHLSLAYATGSVGHEKVASLLADVEPIGAMRVGAVHLVSVTVRPERGTFDFTSLANWDLQNSH